MEGNNINNNNDNSLDLKVHKMMKSLINYWHNYEKNNYSSGHQNAAYKNFMSYYTDLNPYNLLTDKYQNRLQEKGIASYL
jgi:hypothetical protein